MPRSLTARTLVSEVRDPQGVVAKVTLAHCTCPDQTWRDHAGAMHFCKHIITVYANKQRALRSGRTVFRVPSMDRIRRLQGAAYKVTAFRCVLADGTRCPDNRPGVLALCEHLQTAYEFAGYPPAKDTEVA